MARGINKVILVGNLGENPEIRYAGNGNPVASFSMATSEVWKDKQTGEQQQRTEWHRVVLYNRLAEICQQYFQKGTMLYLEGKLQTRKWQDNNGHDRYTTEVVGNEVQILNRGKESGSQAQPQQQNQGQSQPAPSNDFDDDIPF